MSIRSNSVKVDFIKDFSTALYQLDDQILAFAKMPTGDFSVIEAQYMSLKQTLKDSQAKYAVEDVHQLRLLGIALQGTRNRIRDLKELKPMLQAKKDDILRPFLTESQNPAMPKATIKRSILNTTLTQLPKTPELPQSPAPSVSPSLREESESPGLRMATPFSDFSSSSRESTPSLKSPNVFAVFAPKLFEQEERVASPSGKESPLPREDSGTFYRTPSSSRQSTPSVASINPYEVFSPRLSPAPFSPSPEALRVISPSVQDNPSMELPFYDSDTPPPSREPTPAAPKLTRLVRVANIDFDNLPEFAPEIKKP